VLLLHLFRGRGRGEKKTGGMFYITGNLFFSFFSKFVTIVIFIENCPKLNEFFEILFAKH
jgi:hypothetical protein